MIALDIRLLSFIPTDLLKIHLIFWKKSWKETPFPIQRIQTDRGREFFADKVQLWLMDNYIKFRPIRPGSPHLNGKVERAQKTDLEEFYAMVNLKDERLRDLLAEWPHHYSWQRIHGTIGMPPMDRYFELQNKIPYWDEVVENYDRSKERFREQCYDLDVRLAMLK
jgi:transposase InsO family protein